MGGESLLCETRRAGTARNRLSRVEFTVDTIDAPIVSLPHQLLGVALNPGTHDVRFSFTLEGIKVYAVVFILTALLDCLLIAQYIWQLLSRVRE